MKICQFGIVVTEGDCYPYRYPEGYYKVTWQFDFFNYAGIHRPVKLYTTPANRVEDVTISTTPQPDSESCKEELLRFPCSKTIYIFALFSGNLGVTVSTSRSTNNNIRVSLLGSGAYKVLGYVRSGETAVFTVVPDYLWWPYTMDKTPGFLHLLKVNETR